MSRIEKVQEELRHHLSMIVQNRLNDPRLGFVTITKVKVTPDLRQASIYFTTMDDGDALEDTIQALDRARGYVRKLIAEMMRMKFTPALDFMYDDSQAKRERIDEIIDKIHKEKETGG